MGSLLLILLLLFDLPVYLLSVLLCLFMIYFYFKGYYLLDTLYNNPLTDNATYKKNETSPGS